jgi:hypothetical protein
VGGKTVKGVNFFEPADKALLHALQNPRVNIGGIRRGNLLPEPANLASAGQNRGKSGKTLKTGRIKNDCFGIPWSKSA